MMEPTRRVGLLDTPEFRVEMRGENGNAGPTLFGYAVVFNSRAHMGGYDEIVKPGAFTEVLATNPDVSARVQHAGGITTIGRTANGTLRIEQDTRGLHYEVDLPNTTAGRDIAELVRRGDINKSSFAFDLDDDSWHWEKGEPMLFVITRVSQLYDVAPVDGPAYDATSVSLRSASEKQLEKYPIPTDLITIPSKTIRERIDEVNAALQVNREDFARK